MKPLTVLYIIMTITVITGVALYFLYNTMLKLNEETRKSLETKFRNEIRPIDNGVSVVSTQLNNISETMEELLGDY